MCRTLFKPVQIHRGGVEMQKLSNPNVTSVAIDVGNGKFLDAAVKGIDDREVRQFYGDGKIFSHKEISVIEDSVRDSGVFVCSFSSNPEKVEQEAHLLSFATAHRVTTVAASDIDATLYRGRWTKGAIRHVDIATVVAESELPWAREQVGEHTVLNAIPNPLWLSNYSVTKRPEEVLAGLGVNSESKLIVVPGDKEVERMIMRLVLLIKAILKIRMKLHIVVTMHRGADHNIGAYKRLVDYSPVPLTFSIQEESGISTLEAISACKIAVVGNGTSNAYAAVGQGKPMITVIDNLVDNLYWQNLGGQDSWGMCDTGASALATDSVELQRLITELLAPHSSFREEMLEAQKTHYPRSRLESASAAYRKLITG